MRKLVNDTIDYLKFQIDYVLNNSDFTSNYDQIVVEQIQYYTTSDHNSFFDFFTACDELYDFQMQNLSDKERDQLIERSKLFNQLSEIQKRDLFDHFLDDMRDPSYCCDIEICNLGYSMDYHRNSVCQISIGEQEFEIDPAIQKSKFKKGIIDKIERETDTVINSDNYAYFDLSGSFICYRLTDEYILELMEFIKNDLLTTEDL